MKVDPPPEPFTYARRELLTEFENPVAIKHDSSFDRQELRREKQVLEEIYTEDSKSRGAKAGSRDDLFTYVFVGGAAIVGIITVLFGISLVGKAWG